MYTRRNNHRRWGFYLFSIKKNKKLKVTTSIIMLLLVVAVGVSTYYLNYYKVDFNRQLPMVVSVEPDNKDLESIAYGFWIELTKPYTDDNVSSWKRLSDVRYDKIQLLAGDETEFAVGVTFSAKLEKKNWSIHNNWGKVQEDGAVRDIQWTLRIKQVGENNYSLAQIEETTDAVAGLPPVKDTYQKDAGIAVPDENIRYEIENGQLKVTYNNGGDWKSVPTSLDELFAGDYSGSQEYLIDGSYVITRDRTVFVIGEEIVNKKNYPQTQFKILQTTDEGETWEKTNVTDLPGVRARFLGFTSDENGYLIISYDRTMGFEGNAIYKTNDGGESWKKAGTVEQTYRHVTGGGFSNENLGFMSFGSFMENDGSERPSLYRTADGGEGWDEIDIPIPIEYKGIFTIAEIPAIDGTQGVLLVNQGPNGDYQGGKVLARFTTVDKGATWFFSNLVDPDNVIDK